MRARRRRTDGRRPLQLESLDRLTSKAVETVNVQVAGACSRWGSLLKGNDPEEKDIND